MKALNPRKGAVATTVRAGADIAHRHGDAVTGELMGQGIAFASPGDGTHYRDFAAVDLNLAFTGGAALTGSFEAGLDTTGGYSALAHAGISGAF